VPFGFAIADYLKKRAIPACRRRADVMEFLASTVGIGGVCCHITCQDQGEQEPRQRDHRADDALNDSANSRLRLGSQFLARRWRLSPEFTG
jgi:hypothetical protein